VLPVNPPQSDITLFLFHTFQAIIILRCLLHTDNRSGRRSTVLAECWTFRAARPTGRIERIHSLGTHSRMRLFGENLTFV